MPCGGPCRERGTARLPVLPFAPCRGTRPSVGETAKAVAASPNRVDARSPAWSVPTAILAVFRPGKRPAADEPGEGRAAAAGGGYSGADS